MTVRAEVVETLGAELFVHLACGAHSLVARIEVHKQPLSVGQTLQVDLKMLKSHVFDKETMQAVV